jgi:hypothetical protein
MIKRGIPESLSGLAKHKLAQCLTLQNAGYRERMREAWLLLYDHFGPGTIPLLNFAFLTPIADHRTGVSFDFIPYFTRL